MSVALLQRETALCIRSHIWLAFAVFLQSTYAIELSNNRSGEGESNENLKNAPNGNTTQNAEHGWFWFRSHWLFNAGKILR